MKPTTEKGFRDKIRRDLKSSGLYREEFERVIWRLAELYVRMQRTRAEFEKSGGQPIIQSTNKAGAKYWAKNPLLQELDFVQRTALDLERELGLTPAALKKINEAAMMAVPEEDPLSAALGKLRIV